MIPLEFQNVWCSDNNFSEFIFTQYITIIAVIAAKQKLPNRES